MENFTKPPERPETKKPTDDPMPEGWKVIAAEASRLPTAPDKMEAWWKALAAAEPRKDYGEPVGTKFDDNGKPYLVDGKPRPDATYVLNGSAYKTDDKGRIISCEGKPRPTPENPRDHEAQSNAGGPDRKPGDQGGHIVGRDLGGDGGAGNLIAMDSRINLSDYKRLENGIKRALAEGREVSVKTAISYRGDSERPDKITVTVTVDGKTAVYTFDNNLDGSLMEKVAENGTETDVAAVQSVLDETGGLISSVKEEYDRDGHLEKTTVYITYADDDGKNQRTAVVIEHGGPANDRT